MTRYDDLDWPLLDINERIVKFVDGPDDVNEALAVYGDGDANLGMNKLTSESLSADLTLFDYLATGGTPPPVVVTRTNLSANPQPFAKDWHDGESHGTNIVTVIPANMGPSTIVGPVVFQTILKIQASQESFDDGERGLFDFYDVGVTDFFGTSDEFPIPANSILSYYIYPDIDPVANPGRNYVTKVSVFDNEGGDVEFQSPNLTNRQWTRIVVELGSLTAISGIEIQDTIVSNTVELTDKAYLAGVNLTLGSDYFDGSKPQSGDFKYRWTGTPFASTSEEYTGGE